MDRNRLVSMILVGLVIINISWTAAIYTQVSAVENEVDEIQQTQDRLQKQVIGTVNISNGTDGGFASRQVTVPALAYDTSSGEGRLIPFNVVTIAGKGIYVNTRPVTYDIVTQASFRVAYSVAYNSSYAPETTGVVISIEAPKDWENVGGESAGLTTAMAIAATSHDVKLNETVVMTGGLTKTGKVERVTHIREKAKAAKKAGYDVFLVPYGQAVSVEGIRVIPVETFTEAASYALEPEQNSTNTSA